MQRRQFLRSAGGALAASMIPAVHTAWAAPRRDERPNILFAIGDDPSWAHFGAYGERAIKTPTFDRIAREGVLFTNTYCSAPTCTASRGAILTGQAFFRLEEGGDLWSTLPAKFPVYPDLLEQAGYQVGLTRKGWGPGQVAPGGRTRNAAGPNFRTFEQFLGGLAEGKPFCFWFGCNDPHRPYQAGSGAASGMKIEDVKVPPFLPDTPEVRSDILDYGFEIQRFDRETGEMLRLLEEAGKLENTIVVMTGDNGMPFPRSKANLYEYGTHLPLAVRWPAGAKGGRTIDDFVSFTDYAPTFLDAAGLKPPAEMTGRSILGLLTSGRSGQVDPKRDRVVVGRERHANCREGNIGYPSRALRTRDFLYIRNYKPERWPAGDPERYGDIDGGPTKSYMQAHRDDPKVAPLYALAFEKRPAEELYDLKKDPGELSNVAARPEYAAARRQMRADLDAHLAQTKDPRATGGGDEFDRYPYYGGDGARR